MPDESEMLDPAAVADRLNVTTRTLARWRETDAGPPFVALTARTVKYPAAKLQQWIEAKRGGERDTVSQG